MVYLTRSQRRQRAQLIKAGSLVALALVAFTPKDLSALGALVAPLNPVGVVHAQEAPSAD
ncbi:hypothetical protein [Devosia sediminis]|uniref:Uncharacterized protein n=1 Tax=Devosia sediminis TaxID=2798801 RepID=A0A934IWB5_9HYPH|nr:hypothetical protein [Devosia sediminis]MBJ3785542.1 hypothetical protein [Devosia sediminis]